MEPACVYVLLTSSCPLPDHGRGGSWDETGIMKRSNNHYQRVKGWGGTLWVQGEIFCKSKEFLKEYSSVKHSACMIWGFTWNIVTLDVIQVDIRKSRCWLIVLENSTWDLKIAIIFPSFYVVCFVWSIRGHDTHLIDSNCHAKIEVRGESEIN